MRKNKATSALDHRTWNLQAKAIVYFAGKIIGQVNQYFINSLLNGSRLFEIMPMECHTMVNFEFVIVRQCTLSIIHTFCILSKDLRFILFIEFMWLHLQLDFKVISADY